MSVWLEGSMVSHFGSFKKKLVRIWLCSFKQGVSHWSRLAEREKHLFTSQLFWPPSFLAVFCSLFVAPKAPCPGTLARVSPGGVPKLWSPWAKELQPFIRNNQIPGVLPKDQLLPLFLSYPSQSCLTGEPFSRREGTAWWEMGRKGKTRMWLTEANKK